MNGLLKYNYADPDATGVAHDNIDGILAGNRQDKLEKDIAMHGSIGPTPYMETEEGQQALMDIAMGSAFPGAAIGRVSNAALTGGQLSRAGKTGKAFYGRLLKDMSPKEFVRRADWDNKLTKGRLETMKAYEKHDIPFQPFHFDPAHHLYKSRTADDIVDNVTLLLNKIKRN